MEPPSAQGHRGRVPWQGLLLVVSLSTFWIPPVTAPLTVEPEPANVAEGKDVLLRVNNLSEEPLKYDWYKGRGVDSSQRIISYRVDYQNPTTGPKYTGPKYTGRETIYPNGSLLIRKVTKADTGDYNILVLYKTSLTSAGGTGRFQVLASIPTHTVFLDDQWETPKAPCRCSLSPTSLSDGGSYNCLIHNSVTGLNRTTLRTIKVSEPAATPSIQASNTTVTEHKDSVILTCLTRDTGISILWLLNNQCLRFTDRMTLSQDNSSLTISPVRREDAGEYQCEVSNLASSSKSDPLTLTVNAGGDTTGLWAGAKTDIVIGGTMALVALAAILGCVVLVKNSRRRSGNHNLRVQQQQESTPGAGPSSHSSNWTTRPDPRSSIHIYEELQKSSANDYCHVNNKADVVS